MKSPLFRGVIFGIMLLALSAGIFSSRQAHAASSANCDNNAVVFCGASSVNGLIAKYNNGDAHNSAASIQHIYSGFGISASDVRAMGTTAQSGTVTSSGNVFVGNQLVATSALTAGRQDIEPGSSRQANQGTVFFTRTPSVSFLSNQLPAFVVMKNGVFQFAILTSCGNPVTAHPKTTPPSPAPKPKQPPVPTPQPKPVKPAPVQKTVNNVCSGNTSNTNSGTAAQGGNCSTNTTVVQTQTQAPPATPSATPTGQCISMSAAVNQDDTLTATAMVNFQTQGGAQLQSIMYDFGDGVTIPPTTQTTLAHTYQQAGTYTVTATLAFTDDASQAAVAPATCQAAVTATAPPVTTPPATVDETSAPVSPAATPAPTTQTPSTQLVNTGPGDILGLFAVISAVGAIGYRLFLVRYLSGRPY